LLDNLVRILAPPMKIRFVARKRDSVFPSEVRLYDSDASFR
jgi:hypothetical protein